MTGAQRLWFLETIHDFRSLSELNLVGQNIDDEFILELCVTGLSYLRVLHLSHNPKITILSLDFILNSSTMGNRLSQCRPSPNVIINVLVSDTAISDLDQEHYNNKHSTDFIMLGSNYLIKGTKKLCVINA